MSVFASAGDSKLGAAAKLSTPVDEWIANLALSAPPAIDQVTAMLAVKVNTLAVFSATDTAAVAPVDEAGPVIVGPACTVRLAAALALPASSVAAPAARLTVMAATAEGVTVRRYWFVGVVVPDTVSCSKFERVALVAAKSDAVRPLTDSDKENVTVKDVTPSCPPVEVATVAVGAVLSRV